MDDAYKLLEEFRHVSDVFERFCKERELAILAEAVEKHGSWEWAAMQRKAINRFVTVDLTGRIEALGGARAYMVETAAEAESEDPRRMTPRLVVSAFLANERVMAGDEFKAKLAEALQQAWVRASKLHEHDLLDPVNAP